jgi:hypothetical protein
VRYFSSSCHYIYVDTIICIIRQFDSNREETGEYESSKIPELKIFKCRLCTNSYGYGQEGTLADFIANFTFNFYHFNVDQLGWD